MKTPVTLIALLFTLVSYAGSSTTTDSRFYAGVSFTPGVSYRLLIDNYHKYLDNKQLISSRNSYESPWFAYAVGFKAGYHIRKFVAIETGVEYLSAAYQWKQSGLTVWSGYRPDLTYDSTMLGSAKGKYGYHFLNIPVAFNFTVGKQKVKAIFSAGATLNVLLGQWQQTSYNIPGDMSGSSYKTTTSIRGLHRFNLSPFIGIGADWEINNLMTLLVMPTASIQALKASDTPVTEHLYTAGINLSLLFGLPRHVKQKAN